MFEGAGGDLVVFIAEGAGTKRGCGEEIERENGGWFDEGKAREGTRL